jgi:hypothetical protein
MKGILRFIAQVYSRLIKLFPLKFQAEFGEEMQVVFSEIVAAAAGRGNLALAVACSREMMDFPILLVHSHLEEKSMLNLFRSQPSRFAFRGAVGFSLGLACVRAFSLFLVFWLSTAFGGQMGTGWPHVLAVLVGCGLAAIAGGLLFVLLFSDRERLGWYALVGGLGWFIPQACFYVLNQSLYTRLGTDQSYILLSILPYAVFALVGGYLSMMLCVAESKQRTFLWPMIAAAVVFPALSYIIPQISFPGNYPSWFSLFADLGLLAVLLATALFLAIKSYRKGLWMVVAGTVGFPIIYYLSDFVIYKSHLNLNTVDVLHAVINTGITAIPEGIVFGLIIGLIFGWQRGSTQAAV